MNLHKKFLSVCDNVYFQPPEDTKMKYPCIRYSVADDQCLYAGNKIYNTKDRYSVTVISRDPDDELFEVLRNFSYSYFDRAYVSDNLHHYIFQIFS
jgi:hypothetical protein